VWVFIVCLLYVFVCSTFRDAITPQAAGARVLVWLTEKCTKKSTRRKNKEQRTENKEQRTKNREQRTENKPGMQPRCLLLIAVASELSMQNEELRTFSHGDTLLHSSFSILHSIESLLDKSLLREVEGPGGAARFMRCTIARR